MPNDEELLLTPERIIEVLKEANGNYKPSREHYLVLNSDIELKALLKAQLAKAKPIIEKQGDMEWVKALLRIGIMPKSDPEKAAQAIKAVVADAVKQERAKWIPTNLVIVGVAYRFYPGGVECVITDQDEAGFNETKGFAKADIPEFYDRHELASKALLQALKGE